MLTSAEIAAACRDLVEYRPSAALDIAGEEGSGLDPVAAAIRLCARGLMAERDDPVSAARFFDEVYASGVPLPELLLVCGRHYLRAHRHDRAHHCFSLLQNVEPDAMREFLDALPAAERVRYAPWAIRRLAGPRPDLYGLQPWKASLAHLLGAETAAAAFASMADIGVGTIESRPLNGLIEHARARAIVYEELFGSRTVVLTPPRQLRTVPQEAVSRRSRTVAFCVVRDVVVTGKSNVLLSGGRAALDLQPGEPELYPLDLDVDPVVFAPGRDAATVLIGRGARECPPVPRALTLTGVHTSNFGHWLLEFLPRVWAAARRDGFDEVTILVDARMHPQLRPALEFFVGPSHPIRELEPWEAVRVEELWTCSSIVYFPVGPRPGESENDDPLPIDAEAFAAVVEWIRPRLEALSVHRGGRRVYLSRQDSQHRRLVNRQEVEAFFADRGFEIYDPGALPFVEQLRRIREADVVVGPDGSAMWLAFLAERGTRVGYLNNPFLEEHWWVQANHLALGHRFLVLTGDVVALHPDYRKFSDYRIDVASLDAFLDELFRE